MAVTEDRFAMFLESNGWKWFTILALAYFGLRALGVLWGILGFFGKHCCRSCCQGRNSLKKRYMLRVSDKGYDKDKKAWAVVTGGSDGIGFAMCQNLAEQGFNVCIVARNKEKMTQKLKIIEDKIKLKKPDFKWETKTLVVDFGTVFFIEDYKKQVADPLADLDVAVLALNAGYNQNKAWLTLDDKAIQDTVMLNALQPAYIAKVMAAQLNRRREEKGRKAGLIFVSSAASVIPFPGNLIYSASKTFASYLGEGLYYEFENKVDVLAYNPASVDTNMNPVAK